MYDAAHFISSKTQSGFPGFPMPDTYPDYPRHDQILAYIRSYADHHGLTGRVQTGTRVEHARPREGDGGWDVLCSDGTRREWSALVVATGVTWFPNRPTVPGTFDGEQMHAREFRSAEIFRGRRVLIVGGGNSGADIACEAARHADAAFLSLRRGYHFVPKYLFGVPADVFAHSGPSLPPWLEEKVFGALLRYLIVGDLRRFGLPAPDHPILRSHPIMNTQVLHYLGHGDLTCVRDVRALQGRAVEFVDGRRVPIDLIVWATGYQRRFPFLEESGEGGKLDLYLECCHRRHRDLFLMGLFETDGAAYELFGLQAQIIAAYLEARERRPEVARRFDAARATERPDLHGGRRYLDSQRHAYYVRSAVYQKALQRALRELS